MKVYHRPIRGVLVFSSQRQPEPVLEIGPLTDSRVTESFMAYAGSINACCVKKSNLNQPDAPGFSTATEAMQALFPKIETIRNYQKTATGVPRQMLKALALQAEQQFHDLLRAMPRSEAKALLKTMIPEGTEPHAKQQARAAWANKLGSHLVRTLEIHAKGRQPHPQPKPIRDSITDAWRQVKALLPTQWLPMLSKLKSQPH